jgi:hypothetical protein
MAGMAAASVCAAGERTKDILTIHLYKARISKGRIDSDWP